MEKELIKSNFKFLIGVFLNAIKSKSLLIDSNSSIVKVAMVPLNIQLMIGNTIRFKNGKTVRYFERGDAYIANKLIVNKLETGLFKHNILLITDVLEKELLI